MTRRLRDLCHFSQGENCPLGPLARPWKRALPAPLAVRLRRPTPAQSGEVPESPMAGALRAPGLPVVQPFRGPKRDFQRRGRGGSRALALLCLLAALVERGGAEAALPALCAPGERRPRQRAEQPPLPPGRPVTSVSPQKCDRVMEDFDRGFREHEALSLDVAFDRGPADPRAMKEWLEELGRQLVAGGRAYGRYSGSSAAASHAENLRAARARPGSIRAGAATTCYQVPETADRLCIRGRWVIEK